MPLHRKSRDKIEKELHMRSYSERGFTLVELLVVMLIFVMVIIIAGSTFSTLLKYSSRLGKSAESNIEGVVGLEIFRHDIEQAGFGLPDSFPASGPPVYQEALPISALPSTSNNLNDSPNGVPRAIVCARNLPAATNTGDDGASYATIAGTDYLSIKASSVGSSEDAQDWSYVKFGDPMTGSTPPNIWPSGNMNNGDIVIALRRSFTTSGATNQLTFDQTRPGTYWTTYNSGTGLTPPFSPNLPQEIVYLYGISSIGPLRMPFNRADYFLAAPQAAGKLPTYCAPGTGILYKTLVNQTDGSMKYFPVLDCAAAMHVVLGWSMLDASGNLVTDPDQEGAGTIDTWTDADGTNVSSTSAQVTSACVQSALADPGQIRTKLKEIKVYVLAQYGKKDASYISPASFQLYNSQEEGATPGVTFNLPQNMLNYRWKVYRVTVRPNNLFSNQ